MNGLSPKEYKKMGLAPIAGIVTNSPISEEMGLSAGGMLNLRVAIEVTGVTVVGAITAKLQHRSPGGAYEDLVGANATVAITAAGSFSIRQNVEVAADQPNMPIHKMTRVVISTTNAGDAVTISKLYLQQQL